MIGAKYMSAAKNPSGYGQAARNFIASLYVSQVDVTTETISQMADSADYGWLGSLVNSLEGRQIDYKIKILHVTPDLYMTYMEKGKYHIGHLFFETDKLPKAWVAPCNQVAEIWTASEQQAQMIKNSGVTTPIKWFPQPIDISPAESPISEWQIPNFSGFKFLSIAQWIERKNPKALLTAYWKTFSGIKDVVLILKTYRNNYSDSEFNKIKEEIKKWKTELGLTHYPRVLLVKKLLNSQEVFKLHKSADCFVSSSSAEGWGIPMIESSLMGNPVIAINKTGFADVFPKEIFYPVDCNETQAKQVHWIPWYSPEQNWWEIDEKDLASKMLEAYGNKQQVKEKGEAASVFVKENLNFWTIGEQMKKRLEEISKIL